MINNILIYLLFILFFITCQRSNERCGQIVQKVSQNNVYYFILQTDDYANSYGDPELPIIPDDGIRQGSISKETYEAFNIGEDYCALD